MIRYLLFILLLCSCQKNDFDIIITNKSLSIDDTLSINFKNNSSENYLFYFESKKLRYFPKTPNSLNLVIMNNQNPIEVVYSLSDPLWLIDENGKMSIEDSTSQSKYFDCKTKYSELFIIIPAKSNFVLKRKLIDSIDDCGIKNYPILKKNMLFKTSLKLNSDSSLISKKVMKKINKIRKEKKVKLFQGQINSNTVLLNSEEAF